MRRAQTPLTRAHFHAANGVLLITREPPPAPPAVKGQPAIVGSNPAEGLEILLAVWDDGSVTALNGHVDLGTGLRTALTQIVAEELDVNMTDVNMVLGDTTRAPNQGATIASASIQIHAQPLRAAAAQARAWLLERAAQQLRTEVSQLNIRAGVIGTTIIGQDGQSIGYGELIQGLHVELLLALNTPVKSPNDYRLVGTSVERVDIGAKATGELIFVHDMRVPGMLHGRVVRPPYAGVDQGDFIGNTLDSVDESSIAHIPGIRKVLVIRDFIGIVAEREEYAEQALRELRVHWKSWPALQPLTDLAQALRNNPSTRRTLVDEGDVDSALASAAQTLHRDYVWPYQMHASIGPSCALADWQSEHLTVWAGSQNPHVLREDLSRLMNLSAVQIDVIRMEASGCYGRNCSDDVAADAALLSRAVGQPVRVQLTREQENAWEPKGAAQLMQVQGGLNADGSVAAYDFQTCYPSNGSPTLALLLTGTIKPIAQAYEMGDRTARPPYDYANLRVTVNDMPPILRASWLRGVSALPNSFAHESYIDELATAAGVDPIEFRLRYLHEPRAVELIHLTAERAAWKVHTQPGQQGTVGITETNSDPNVLCGQGVAYARYMHSKWPGFGAAWAAWVADVEVNRVTGDVHVKRVVVGHDAGTLINPAGVKHQIHGNVIQTTSRALYEKVQLKKPDNTVANLEWGSYPILNFRDVPIVEIVTMPRPGEPPLGVGESSSVPGTAAIANAIFDATGVRFRQPPFTPEVVRAALNTAVGYDSVAAPSAPKPQLVRALPTSSRWPQRLSWASRSVAVLGGLLGLAVAIIGWRVVLPPTLSGGNMVYSQATLERGKQLAALGNCVGCHTVPGSPSNTGGLAIQTPFGRVFSTNLTPDPQTGLGLWSYAAFERAMREGISRDGRHLYPAFPFTSFAKTSDQDLTALYAYLMAQPPVSAPTPPAQMVFPFNMRSLITAWNGIFHDSRPFVADPSQSAEWNRGAYLVNSLGHCSACHTPRNALGAELGDQAFLSGAIVHGWEAPALTALSRAPVPWSEAELYRYLRQGHTKQHGVATGSMGDVVKELRDVPDADVLAMARYLASFNELVSESQSAELADQVVLTAQQAAPRLRSQGQRLFNGACASCHHDGDGPRLLGINTPLALNSNLHSTRPDNLIRTIFEGIRTPVSSDSGFMPAFEQSLNDEQIAALASYMRSRYAPTAPEWPELSKTVSHMRDLYRSKP